MKYSATILLLLLGVSCTWKSDSEAPDIYVTEPKNNATMVAGDSVPYEISAVDDQVISEIRFSIAPQFDSLWVESWTLPGWWAHGDTAISGNTFFWKGYWQLPDSISVGSYLLTCEATDANGQTEKAEVPFKIDTHMDSLAPTIDTFEAEDTVDLADDSLPVHVRATDNLSLRYFTLQLLKDNEEVWRTNVTVNNAVVDWDSTFANPGGPGSYTLRLVVRDWVNKTRTQSVGVVFQ